MGGLYHTIVALKLQQFQYGPKFFFGAFSAWYFPCVFVKATPPPHGEGGVAGGGGGYGFGFGGRS